MTDREIQLAIAGSREATARLFQTVDALEDSALLGPSLLPGWSIGHVLTHLARNADSYVRILGAAAEGREVMQYQGGDAGRSDDIEQGAKRPVGEIRRDLRAASERLEATFAEVPEVVWQRRGLRNDGGPFPCRVLPVSRWREVEVHHGDLGLGYGVADWPAEFVTADLPHALDRLPARIDDPKQRTALLAWLYGRAAAPERLDLEQF